MVYDAGHVIRRDDKDAHNNIIDTLENVPTDKRTEEQVQCLANLLTSLNFFKFRKQMSYEDVCTVTKYIKYERYEPGKYVFKQGDNALNFYMVLKGTLQLQIPSPFTERLVEPPMPKADLK